jgi:hypothetical protein
MLSQGRGVRFRLVASVTREHLILAPRVFWYSVLDVQHGFFDT